MIHENMTLAECALVLRAAGLTIERLAREGREFVAVLAVEPAHAPEGAILGSEGRGPTLATALEDARLGWVRWQERLAVRGAR